MDVHDVDDAALPLAEKGRRRLGEKERGLEVAAQQLVPLCLADVFRRGGIEAGGIVYQCVKAALPVIGLADQLR